MTIASISVIETQALKASEHYTNVNDACPYPFHSEAGQLFKRVFNEARRMQNKAVAPANAIQLATKGIAA